MEIVAAAFLTVCVPTIVGLLMLGSDGRWGIWTLPQVLFHVPLALVAAAVVAWLIRRNDSVATLLFATLLAWILIDAVSLSAWNILGYAYDKPIPANLELLFLYGPLAWLAVAAARFALGLVPGGAPRRGWVVLAFALLLAFPLGYVHHERSLWIKDWAKDSDAEGMAKGEGRWAAAGEDTFYRQPELLARELAAVEPGRKGVIEVFFVGFGGHAYQDVFMREVDSVAKLMRDRFGADGHIVKLVNNTKTTLTTPIASTTSLRRALERTAQMMDVEEDVLVLFLTSHGSAKHRFSLDLWPLRFNELNPPILRQILDESGIRNRVVIISACYAGGFVEALKDDRTVVITAAAPDKNSFGCSNENEWTYFGRAYFDEALRKTHSFTQAFELAKPIIVEREKAQKYEPSDPRMAAGESIKVKLAELERQLQSGSAVAVAGIAGAEGMSTRRSPNLDRYLALTFDASYARQFADTCRENMRLTSPERWLEKDPMTFGGFNKSSPQWSRLALAWERFSEEFCTKANDPTLHRGIYEEQVRAVMAEKDIEPIVQFLSTDVGRRWSEKEREASRRQAKQLGKIQDELSKSGYQRYVDEQARILADFRKDKN